MCLNQSEKKWKQGLIPSKAERKSENKRMLLSELAVPQHHGPRCMAPHMIIVSGRRHQNTRFLPGKPISKNNSGDDKYNNMLKKYLQSDCNKMEHSGGSDTVSTESSYSSLESQEPEESNDEEFLIFEKLQQLQQQPRQQQPPLQIISNEPSRWSTNDDSHSHQALNDLGACSGASSPSTSLSSPCREEGRVRSAPASDCPFSCFRRTSLPSSSSSSSDKQTKSVRFGNVQLVLTDTQCWDDNENDDKDDATDDDHANLPTRWHDRSEYSVDEYEEKLLHIKEQNLRNGIHRLQYEKAKLEMLEYKLMASITRHQLRSSQTQNNNKQQEQQLENNDATTINTATTCSTKNSNCNNNHHSDRTAATIIVPQSVRNNKIDNMIMIPFRWRRWRRAAVNKRKAIQRLLRSMTTTTRRLSAPSQLTSC